MPSTTLRQKNMKKQVPLLLGLFILLFFPHHVFAASFDLQNAPSQIGTSDEYTVDVTLSISVPDGTVYYLRGAFYKQGTSNYCGYTWNGSNWFNGPYTADWKQLLKITIVNHSWSGQVKAKIDSSDSGCNSSGAYQFRLERFNDTSSDGGGTFNDTQNEQTVTVIIPTPTPTPTDVPTPTATPKLPTSTPTPKTPTATPTIKPTKILSPTPTLNPAEQEVGKDQSILADAIAPTDIPTISPSPTTAVLGATTGPNIKAIIFYSLGGILFVICGILLFRQYKLSQSNESTSDND